jgi:hypothetical protein
MMFSKGLTAALAAVCAVAFALSAGPAASAPAKKKPVADRNAGTLIVNKDESGRTRTRIVVQKRSFLDGGNEVLPGERKFTDYVYPPGYSPTSVIDNTGGWHRSPLPGAWDLTGRNNPYPWMPF